MLAPQVEHLIDAALEEDLGRGDPTSEIVFAARDQLQGKLVAKQPLRVCGLAVCARVFARVDPATRFTAAVTDGDEARPGTVLAHVAGGARAVLGAERTALNFLQRLSGVATLTSAYVAAARAGRARIVDTRKTTPGWRALEKYAVRVGGGANHRADLSGGILIKDNHVAACGSVTAAVQRALAGAVHTLKVEVEVTSLAELDEAIAAGADIVLLDNMDDATIRAAVERAGGKVILEASGGVSLERVGALSRIGVDLISVGKLTHSAPAADISLEVERGT
ncbi:MAG TPA: carboxylating nicotinate-nucleotide diphosphorylase [Polyangia bacterium]|jgi:nicotinate-nucleotide pyrophosphorylase (carboxylating)